MIRLFPLLALFLVSCAPVPPPASRAAPIDASSLPPMLSFSPRPQPATDKANGELIRDFLELSFMLESGRRLPYFTRFEGPVTVRIEGDAPPTLAADLRALLTRLQQEAGIDISMTGAASASVTVQAVSQEELGNAVPRAACFVVPRVSSFAEFLRLRRSPSIDWANLTRRERVAIFVPSDAAPQEIRDCLHEELAQSLGPLNDLYRLPDSVFNDDNIHSVLTGFDMMMLRATYAPELHSGMTMLEVSQRLPAIFSRLNPAGDRPAPLPQPETPASWSRDIEAALTGTTSPAERRRAAARAALMAEEMGLGSARAGFAWYALGRLETDHDPDAALTAFRAAARAFRQSDATRLHEAHVAVQLCAFALSAGDADAVLALSEPAMAVAMRAENAALLATLMMFRAEALRLQGRDAEAAALELDSLGWARYGFGPDNVIHARAAEIAALNPERS